MGEDKRVLGCGECVYLSELKGKLELLEFVGAEEWSRLFFLLFFSKGTWFWLNQFL